MFYVADSDADLVLKTRRMLYLLGIPSIGGSYRMAYYYIKSGLCDAVLLPRPTADGRPKYFCRSVRSHHPGIPTIALAGVTVVLFIVFAVFTNKFVNACRIYRANEKLSSTDDGARLEEIAEYKDLYEKFL